jgi:hypothetical protein
MSDTDQFELQNEIPEQLNTNTTDSANHGPSGQI